MGTPRTHERTLMALVVWFGVSLVVASHGLRRWVEQEGAPRVHHAARAIRAEELSPAPRGIRPPWREPLIPELRRRKGRPNRRMSAEAGPDGVGIHSAPSHSPSTHGRSATRLPPRQTVRTWLTPA